MNHYTEHITKDNGLRNKYDLLTAAITRKGERLPKKHGEWYRIRAFDNNWLVYDTWNGQVYLYPNGAEPSDTDNMYRVVYAFRGADGSQNCETIKPHMADFWRGHIK